MRRLILGIATALVTGVQAMAATPPAVGDPAPAFDLPSDHGGNVKLADFADKKAVILAFYPKDKTAG